MSFIRYEIIKERSLKLFTRAIFKVLVRVYSFFPRASKYLKLFAFLKLSSIPIQHVFFSMLCSDSFKSPKSIVSIWFLLDTI